MMRCKHCGAEITDCTDIRSIIIHGRWRDLSTSFGQAVCGRGEQWSGYPALQEHEPWLPDLTDVKAVAWWLDKD